MAGFVSTLLQPHVFLYLLMIIALIGLWRIQYRALPKYLDGTRAPAEVHQAVTGDVHRAARLISIGLDSFPVDREPHKAQVQALLERA